VGDIISNRLPEEDPAIRPAGIDLQL